MPSASSSEYGTGSGTSLSPFVGPLYAQSGKLISKTGYPLDSSAVTDMNFLVKGVIGTIPKG